MKPGNSSGYCSRSRSLAARTVDARFHGAHRHARHIADFLIGIAVHVTQGERQSLVGRKARDACSITWLSSMRWT